MEIKYFEETDSMIINLQLKERSGELRYIEPREDEVLIWVDEAGRIDSIEILSGASAYDLTNIEPYRGDAKAEYEAAVKAARAKRR
jgi:uncharacterized protein YuzE